MDLSFNGLQDDSLTESFNLPSLTVLPLCGNKLTTIPESILLLPSVKNLDLRFNRLARIPDDLKALGVTLRSLKLSNNSLTSLPPSMSQLVSLEELDLSSNRLQDLENIQGLSKLTSLHAYWNGLITLPENFGDLVELRELYLTENAVKVLPESMSKMVNLRTFMAHYNDLTTLSNNIVSGWTSLNTLNLAENDISSVPSDWSPLKSLTRLDMRANILATLPSTLSSLPMLAALEMGDNNFLTIPPVVFEIVSLTTLSLFSNSIFTVPPQIAALKSLTSLNLSYNQLTALPEEVSSLSLLSHLRLEGNFFKEFPSAIFTLASLKELAIGSNRGIKEIPGAICNLSRLATLQVSSNAIHSLPDSFVQLKSLSELDLSHNRLSILPSDMDRLTALTDLDISGNALTRIPPCFGNMKALQQVKASFNPGLSDVPTEYLKAPTTWISCTGNFKIEAEYYFARKKGSEKTGMWVPTEEEDNAPIDSSSSIRHEQLMSLASSGLYVNDSQDDGVHVTTSNKDASLSPIAEEDDSEIPVVIKTSKIGSSASKKRASTQMTPSSSQEAVNAARPTSTSSSSSTSASQTTGEAGSNNTAPESGSHQTSDPQRPQTPPMAVPSSPSDSNAGGNQGEGKKKGSSGKDKALKDKTSKNKDSSSKSTPKTVVVPVHDFHTPSPMDERRWTILPDEDREWGGGGSGMDRAGTPESSSSPPISTSPLSTSPSPYMTTYNAKKEKKKEKEKEKEEKKREKESKDHTVKEHKEKEGLASSGASVGSTGSSDVKSTSSSSNTIGGQSSTSSSAVGNHSSSLSSSAPSISLHGLLDNLVSRSPQVGWAEMRGGRPDMQDSLVIMEHFQGLPEITLVGLFDGHGGTETALLTAKKLPTLMRENLRHVLEERDLDWSLASLLSLPNSDLALIIRAAFMALHGAVAKAGYTDGTAATIALVIHPYGTVPRTPTPQNPQAWTTYNLNTIYGDEVYHDANVASWCEKAKAAHILLSNPPTSATGTAILNTSNSSSAVSTPHATNNVATPTASRAPGTPTPENDDPTNPNSNSRPETPLRASAESTQPLSAKQKKDKTTKHKHASGGSDHHHGSSKSSEKTDKHEKTPSGDGKQEGKEPKFSVPLGGISAQNNASSSSSQSPVSSQQQHITATHPHPSVRSTSLLVIGNCGDQRAVMCRKGQAFALTKDHKPENTAEMARIALSGGFVAESRRVNGLLALSRAIGDIGVQPNVTFEPDIMVIEFTEQDEFVILACDGVWDVLSNEQAVFLAQAETSPSRAANRIREYAYSLGSTDNISVIVYQLKPRERTNFGTCLMTHISESLAVQAASPRSLGSAALGFGLIPTSSSPNSHSVQTSPGATGSNQNNARLDTPFSASAPALPPLIPADQSATSQTSPVGSPTGSKGSGTIGSPGRSATPTEQAPASSPAPLFTYSTSISVKDLDKDGSNGTHETPDSPTSNNRTNSPSNAPDSATSADPNSSISTADPSIPPMLAHSESAAASPGPKRRKKPKSSTDVLASSVEKGERGEKVAKDKTSSSSAEKRHSGDKPDRERGPRGSLHKNKEQKREHPQLSAEKTGSAESV